MCEVVDACLRFVNVSLVEVGYVELCSGIGTESNDMYLQAESVFWLCISDR